jgi:hypothetical protein
MERTGYRLAVARGATVFERVADDLLGGGAALARERDAAADRERVVDAVRRAHQRGARRRMLVSRRS